MVMKRVRINVGGTVFTTLNSTLQIVPGSKLAALELLTEDHYDTENKEYYFDRDPVIFSSILNLYRTGSLHLSKDVCGIQVKNELEFWGIPPIMIRNCCWKTYYQPIEDIKVLNFLSEEFGRPNLDNINHLSDTSVMSKFSRLKRRTWVFLMNPNSSIYAKIWYWTYLAIVLLSIVTYFVDTFEYCREFEDWVPVSRNRSTVAKFGRIFWQREKPSIRIINITCNVIFMVEFILRFVSSSNKIKFCKCSLNAADFLSAVGFLIVSFVPKSSIRSIYEQCWEKHGHFCMSSDGAIENDWVDEETLFLLIFGHVLLAFRNCRFYRLGRIVQMLKLLILAVRQSARELGLLFLIILINAIVFAGLIFYAELLSGRHFRDYFEAFYWSVITMTTVGYGDVFPDSVIGRCVAILCSITGLILLTMPIAVISNTFSELNARNKDRECYEKNLKLFYNSSNANMKVEVHYLDGS